MGKRRGKVLDRSISLILNGREPPLSITNRHATGNSPSILEGCFEGGEFRRVFLRSVADQRANLRILFAETKRKRAGGLCLRPLKVRSSLLARIATNHNRYESLACSSLTSYG